MRYRIALHQSDEGFSVSVPGLPGCWSQGATEVEALENIKDAIREYIAVIDEHALQAREVAVERAEKYIHAAGIGSGGVVPGRADY